jgi:hypothetical protein
LRRLKTILSEHLLESAKSVGPIVLIIIALCFSIAPLSNSVFGAFLTGAALLILGMSFFNLGVQTAMTPIGERIGTFITRSRKLWIVVLVSFLIGFFITLSEPDLQVLANQIPSVPNAVLVVSVAVGVGLFLVTALLRMLFSIPISWILLVCYIVVFGLAAFVPHEFLAIAFDAGGVTTGPMTVPFIMSLGLGVSAIRSDKHASDDSFGLVALSSVGPILTVMILGLLYHPESADYAALLPGQTSNSVELWGQFINKEIGFAFYIEDVALALAPVFASFVLFQLFAFRMKRKAFWKTIIGIFYTFVGLVLFLTGVNVGFMPAGHALGGILAELPYNWIIIPIAMLIGYFIVAAEPAVHVLNRQVEEISSGVIPAKAMRISLSIGMCISLGLSMIRLLTGISVMWFLIPGYGIALLLAFFVPKIFTAIAFDSGGVASGPMTATFLLPFAIGICSCLDGRTITDAFGIVAMVAMTPLITIQIMGFFYKIRLKPSEETEETQFTDEGDSGIIE